VPDSPAPLPSEELELLLVVRLLEVHLRLVSEDLHPLDVGAPAASLLGRRHLLFLLLLLQKQKTKGSRIRILARISRQDYD